MALPFYWALAFWLLGGAGAAQIVVAVSAFFRQLYRVFAKLAGVCHFGIGCAWLGGCSCLFCRGARGFLRGLGVLCRGLDDVLYFGGWGPFFLSLVCF